MKGCQVADVLIYNHSLCSVTEESMCNRITIKIVRKIQTKEELIDKMLCIGFFPPLLEEHTKVTENKILKKIKIWLWI